MKNEVWGYARVSTKEQNLARQIEQLKEFGISERNIKCDKISEKTFNRMEYNALVGTETTAPTLREGDLLVIVSLDRLGRNYTEIKEQWNYIINVIGADIVVLDMPILDTRKNNDLTGTLIADIVLKVLSYVAEKERINTHERQAQGIALAKDRGAYKGRKPIDVDEGEFEAVYKEVLGGGRTNKWAMDKLGLKTNTYYKAVAKYRTEHGLPPLESRNKRGVKKADV